MLWYSDKIVIPKYGVEKMFTKCLKVCLTQFAIQKINVMFSFVKD